GCCYEIPRNLRGGPRRGSEATLGVDVLTMRRAIFRYLAPIVSPVDALSALRNYPAYFLDRRAFASPKSAPHLREADDLPVLGEATATTAFDSHYTYLDGWAARAVATARPAEHVDVGSRLSFAVGLSAFIPVTFVDIRPARIDLPGFRGIAGDLMALPY